MTETEQALAFALKMYGEKMVAHAVNFNADQGFKKDTYEDMMFWQNQAWMLAEELAREQQG